jgi:hypothetical protein
MIFLTEKSIRQNIKKFGFKDVNSATIEFLNKTLENFNYNSIKNALKEEQKINKQNGGSGAVGHTVLPSKYFGIDSENYFTSAESKNMNVTNNMIRPAIQTHDLSGSIKGGKSKYTGGSGAHGHTVLPSEYFGVNSGSYFEHLKAPNNGTNMNVTNAMIRPAIQTHDLSGLIKGGSIKKDVDFSVSTRAFKNSLNEALLKFKSISNIKFFKSKDVILKFKNDFMQLIGEVLTKVYEKNKNQQLQLSHIKKILKLEKYNILKK